LNIKIIQNNGYDLKSSILINPNNLEDIIHKIEIVSRFETSNIVTYYHHFYEEEVLFLLMEYCSGGNLRDKISTNTITATEAIEWVQDTSFFFSINS
jgi:serine/threonine protein kinase